MVAVLAQLGHSADEAGDYLRQCPDFSGERLLVIHTIGGTSWGRLWGLGCWCGMMSSMSLVIREMDLDEVDLVIDYFHGSTSEHLETMGVDPTRLRMRETVELYFNELALRFLFCEPNAFNVAPNRTLQSVGFRYVKTYKTVPGPLNYHQAVTRWVFEGPLR
jgi:hypothetical protein